MKKPKLHPIYPWKVDNVVHCDSKRTTKSKQRSIARRMERVRKYTLNQE